MNIIQRIVSLIVIVSCLLVLSSAAAQNQPVTITMWHIATEGDPFRPILLQAIDQFNATHFDIRIVAQAIQNESFKEQLQNAIIENRPPDIFQTWGGGLLKTYAETGIVREIPALNGEAGQRFNPQALAFSTFEGRHYAVPANMAGVFLWYNQDLFIRHNIALPTTWQELLSACQAFRQAGVVPIGLGNRDRWPGAFWLIYLAMRLGGTETHIPSFDPANSAVLANPAFTEAGQRIQEAVRSGCFEDNFNTHDFGTAQQLLGTGAAAMQLQGDWNLGGLKQVYPELAAQMRVLPFPIVEGGAGNMESMVGGTGQAFAISAQAPAETEDALIQMLGLSDFGRAVAEAGFIPALAGYEQYISDPIVREMSRLLTDASYVQLYYDQVFSPVLASDHLDTTQQLFDLALSPEEAAQRVVSAAQGGIVTQATSVMPLRELAAAHEIGIGSAVLVQPLANDPTYAETFRREFNVLTPEMAMKMDALRPNPDTYNFADADFLVQFAEANGMQVRGHTLVWHRQLPGWLEQGTFSRDQLMQILRDHILTVVGRYRGRVFAWDVVNEAVDENGQLRDNIWLRVIGPDYIDFAFQWAHEADPDALLFYNDFNNEGLNPKSDAIYQLAQELIPRGVPIHGVGMQMHISIINPPSMNDVTTNMQRIADLGLQVHITELDVQIQGGQGTDQDRLMQQAQLYGDVARVCISVEACTSLAMWGFTDQHTWIPAETGHADAPLIFDQSYQPKPAYSALVTALSTNH